MAIGESNSNESHSEDGANISTGGVSPSAVALTAVLVIVLGTALGFLLHNLFGQTKLEVAVQSCGLESGESIFLDQDGQGLYVDGEGDNTEGLEVEDVVCIVSALDAPDSVVSRMANTTALMGQQTAKWDGITALWNYHPDSGLDINFETN